MGVSSPSTPAPLSSPPRIMLQHELTRSLQGQRSRVAPHEVIVENVQASQQQPPLAPNLFEFARSESPTAEQRQAVLTINDALALLDNTTTPLAQEHPPGAGVRRHLDLAEKHLRRAAASSSSSSSALPVPADSSSDEHVTRARRSAPKGGMAKPPPASSNAPGQHASKPRARKARRVRRSAATAESGSSSKMTIG